MFKSSTSRDMVNGVEVSSETLGIESELSHVHHKATELGQQKDILNKKIESLKKKQKSLSEKIRPDLPGKTSKNKSCKVIIKCHSLIRSRASSAQEKEKANWVVGD